ncbi:39S ribosomal protein L50, mitochondrial [Agrilus planipennis]|uniref:Large ribosomal subunit protein mL50 n=1 Tax=Agrilus planipennis TaxID=224129 RepID=A0A1W4W4B3_AGRPL|nr:39S ribosomal protein L50, mitochondrial [Agrilus planipennis]
MAALVKHGVLKTGQTFSTRNVFPMFYATKAEKKKGIDRKVGPKIDSSAESLAAKGFLRSQKEYQPPEDLESKLEKIFQGALGSSDLKYKLNDLNKRFTVLNSCFLEFQHSIPNSMLHQIETLEDVVKFYSTPLNKVTPLDTLKNIELPKNLHVQYEYHRFHPETDKMFKGLTAFNRSSTIVTGLKYKDKYKGHVQRTTWPYNS